MINAPSSLLPVQYKDIFKLAWPASIAASITPLLGTIDVWVLGRSENPIDIAAVGLAATIFSLIYWTFGFLRMSVAGLTAQALGADDGAEGRDALLRGFLMGALIGLLLVITQWPLGKLAFTLLGVDSQASDTTFANAQNYFSIRIWAAPFALATYACLGWLTARGRTDYLMLTGLIMTCLNIGLDIWFVAGLNWGAKGIALGTMIAEISGFFVSIALVFLMLNRDGLLFQKPSLTRLLNEKKIKRTLSINGDIFIRTLLLSFAFSWFVQRGSAFGDITLAANQVLMQLFLFTGLALDGTAIAAETLVGRAIGQRKTSIDMRGHYNQIVRKTFALASLGALVFSAIYTVSGASIINMLTNSGPIYDASLIYLPWVIISPVIVMVCFQLDGIFIGATRSREMRNSMILSVALYVPASIWLGQVAGNHGLWLAFSLFFIMRAITLWRYMPRISQSLQAG